jgi:protein phosphatase
MRNPVELRLPDPCLLVLVGPAGAGKSTLAGRHFAAAEILSSDAFRARIAGDARDQRATGAAFAALHRALRRRLLAGRLTVVDATSVIADHRRRLARIAAAAGVPALALVLDLPVDVVLARNAARDRWAVPEPVVRRQLGQLAAALRPPGLDGDGFAAVLVLRDPDDVDRLQVVRG